MNTPQARTLGAWMLAASCLVLAGASRTRAADDLEGTTAVNSKVSADYVRARQSDGSFKPEYYAFAEGGRWGGAISDKTIDPIRFIDVARVIAKPLAARNYLPARDPKATGLLIMLYWGTTAVPGPTSDSSALAQFQTAQDNLNLYMKGRSEDPRVKIPSGAPPGVIDAALDQISAASVLLQMENRQNEATDYRNALMLGYDDPGLIGTEKGIYVKGTAFDRDRTDLYAEIEENRYFVVLMAYDFQVLWKQRKHKLLWETRFSISERRNQFDKALPAMAQYASKYFGEDSHGLLRDRVPEGHVDVGDVKSLGEVEPVQR